MGQAASGRLALGAQVVLAAVLPWLAGTLLGPGSAWWPAAVLAAVIVFALVQRRLPLVWLLPLAAVVSLSPLVVDLPPWTPVVTALTAATTAALVLRRVPSAVPHEAALPLAVVGWALVAIGALTGAIAWGTTASSDAAFDAGQAEAAEAWDAPLVVAADSPTSTAPPAGPDGATATAAASDRPSPTRIAGSPGPPGPTGGTAADPEFAPLPLARLTFARPDADAAPVTERALFVGSDVTKATLTRGPGHYPTTALPGAPGNFAVAGHRTGWGSPFLHLDDLRAGDRVRVVDRGGAVHVYVVDRSELVDPDATWVLGVDPLGTGQPTLTLTTCDPPGVNDRRLIVFATLRG